MFDRAQMLLAYCSIDQLDEEPQQEYDPTDGYNSDPDDEDQFRGTSAVGTHEPRCHAVLGWTRTNVVFWCETHDQKYPEFTGTSPKRGEQNPIGRSGGRPFCRRLRDGSVEMNFAIDIVDPIDPNKMRPAAGHRIVLRQNDPVGALFMINEAHMG